MSLLGQLFDIANNQEFTRNQRQQMMDVAMTEHYTLKVADHPTCLALDRALNTERMDIGIRFSLKGNT